MTNENKLRPLNSVGMFDLFKGVFIIQVVLAHTYSLFVPRYPMLYTIFFGSSSMAAFFITNGFGFRKRPVAKCISQQRKTLLVPYICTGVAATLFHGVAHYACFHLKYSAIVESLRITVGFALGLPRTAEYFGYTAFACGVWWFVLSMAFALVLLALLLKVPDEKKQWAAVIAVSLAGWALCQYRRFEIPWCLTRAMAVLPYVYVGYLAKKKKWLEASLPKWYVAALAVSVVFAGVIYNVKDVATDISYGLWNAGPLSILTDGIIGYFTVWVFVRLGRYSGKIVRFFEVIGAHSFEIICVHTAEGYAPWYLLPQIFEGHTALGIVVALLIRMSFIILGCLLIIFVKKKLAAARAGKSAAI